MSEQFNPAAAPGEDQFLPARRVWERYGVTDMTIYRWLHDERMSFPPPVYLGRFRYWKLAELVAWERKRASAPKLDAAGSAAS